MRFTATAAIVSALSLVAVFPAHAEVSVGDVLTRYESLHLALAGDELGKVSAEAGQLEALASDLAKKRTSHAEELKAVSRTAGDLAKSKDLQTARTSFGALSEAVVGWLSRDDESREGRFLFACPMVRGYQKWVQTDKKIRNPYMGLSMPSCGMAAKWD